MKKFIIATTGTALPVAAVVFFLLQSRGDEGSGGADGHLRDLRSLPYITVSDGPADDTRVGVTRFLPEKASPGYNLYADEKHAYLLNMKGETVQRWDFPDGDPEWEHVEFAGGGTILAICNGKKIVKLDRDSNLIWSQSHAAHHDIALDPDGTVLIPVANDHRLYRYRLVEFDSILRLDEDGKAAAQWSTFSHLRQLQRLHPPLELDSAPKTSRLSAALKRFYARRIRDITSPVYEIDRWIRAAVGLEKFSYYHLNTVEVLPETALGKADRRFAAGNILACFRHADLILILDRGSNEIVWSWGPGILDWPHMPTQLDCGSILVYDNGAHRGHSRALEINPVSKEIVWQYRADPPEKFFSRTRGSNQRLPNGNTLICESERGRAFEVTPEGEVVWEFYNPDIRGGKRRLIYRMERIPSERVESWLENR